MQDSLDNITHKNWNFWEISISYVISPGLSSTPSQCKKSELSASLKNFSINHIGTNFGQYKIHKAY